MSTPGDPQKGKPAEDEQIEREAAEAKEATSTEAAADPATEAPAEDTAVNPTEGTAADVTGVQKPAAEAALRAGASEPVAAVDEEASAADADAPADDAADEPADDAADEPAAGGRRRGSRGSRGRRRGGAAADDTPVAEPAPTTRAARERREGERVLVRAQARYVRTSARKARLVCDHIRGKSVPEARAILAHTPRAVARDWSKLLESAIANAEHNHELLGDDLRVFAVTADEGPTLKRFRPRAMGRATRIRKRTSHLTITLTPKE
jgi:ribosomal protein L22